MLSVVFAGLHFFLFLVLLRKQYFRLYPWFSVFILCAAGQSIITMLIPASGPDWREIRRLNMQYWAPGEIISLGIMGCALIESSWKSVSQMERMRRAITFSGLLVGVASLVWVVRGVTAIEQLSACVAGLQSCVMASLDWYGRFLRESVWIHLCYAILAFCSLWFAMFGNRRWPRVARMHSALFAIFCAGHVMLGDWRAWGHSNLHFRWLVAVCYFGWMINASFLSREFAEVQRSLAKSLPQSPGNPSRQPQGGRNAPPDGIPASPAR